MATLEAKMGSECKPERGWKLRGWELERENTRLSVAILEANGQ